MGNSFSTDLKFIYDNAQWIQSHGDTNKPLLEQITKDTLYGYSSDGSRYIVCNINDKIYTIKEELAKNNNNEVYKNNFMNHWNNVYNNIPKQNGGGKANKLLQNKKCLCKDGKYRKVYKIKNKGNSLYVDVAGQAVLLKDVKKKKI